MVLKHSPPSLEEIRSRRKPIRNANTAHQESFSSLERAALLVTQHVGSMGFFLIIFSWTLFWLTWNTLAPHAARFDPFPAFVLWLFISNVVQIMLLPLLMVGQNLQNRHSEARADTQFQINVRAEKEIETILEHLENQNEWILEILQRLDQKE